MPFLVKLLLSNIVIIGCVIIGRRQPTLAGLIATMPLTSLLVLVWLYLDSPRDQALLTGYTRGVVWGIVPTILFFATAHFCLRRQLPLPWALAAGFTVWLAGAVAHQWFVR